MFGWVKMKENKLWGLGVFTLDPLKSFLLKMERKLKEEMELLNGRKYPCALAHELCLTLLFFTSFFSFSFFFFFHFSWLLFPPFFFLPPGHCLFFFFFFFPWTLPFFFFFFFFDLLGKLRPVYIAHILFPFAFFCVFFFLVIFWF